MEELLNEVRRLKIIAKGQERRIALLEAKVGGASVPPALHHQQHPAEAVADTESGIAAVLSGSASSLELTDPIQV